MFCFEYFVPECGADSKAFVRISVVMFKVISFQVIYPADCSLRAKVEIIMRNVIKSQSDQHPKQQRNDLVPLQKQGINQPKGHQIRSDFIDT